MKKYTFLLLGLIVALSACARLPFLSRFQSDRTETPSPTMPTLPEVTNTPTPGSAGSETDNLSVWVPPQFDPQGETESAKVLKGRLESYAAQGSSRNLRVRVKNPTGSGGMIETMMTARDAAPLVLPDVIALPVSLMEQAAVDELITPLPEGGDDLVGEGWYSFSQELSTYGEDTYCVPFAADILVLAYKSDSIEDPPGDWDALLSTQRPLAFAASDPQAIVTLAFYESLGGNIAALDQSLVIDFGPLRQVLNFFQRAYQADVMPYWLTQFESDQQAWEAYTERQSSQVVTWSSNYLQSDSPNTALGALPTQGGKPFSYATGWVWCVANSGQNHLESGVDFIQFMTQASFLADWNAAAGFIPPRMDSFRPWLDQNPDADIFEQILPATKALPADRVLVEIGPLYRDAVLAVLKEQVDPEQAISEIRDQLNNQ